MNKSLLTNIFAGILVGVGWFLDEPFHKPIFNIGLFALSGGITNWLAVHMLFEKVPGMYGSGVIPARFEDFKAAIHNLIMEQFFTKENVERFFKETTDDHRHLDFDMTPIIEKTDFDPAFKALVSVVKESSFGSMLNMFGGEAALQPLKDPFSAKMKIVIEDISKTESFQETLRSNLRSPAASEFILDKVGSIVEQRINELTPQMVNEIIQKMIRKHLGWIVVWGGVCGGLIGLLVSFLP